MEKGQFTQRHREERDAFSLRSQQRIAMAQAEGVFADEIMRVKTEMEVVDKVTDETSRRAVEMAQDTCDRLDTTLENLQALKPVPVHVRGKCIAVVGWLGCRGDD